MNDVYLVVPMCMRLVCFKVVCDVRSTFQLPDSTVLSALFYSCTLTVQYADLLYLLVAVAQ